MKGKEWTPGQACPVDGGTMVKDPRHDPELLATRKVKNTDRPEVGTRYREQVREKAEEYGVIFTCTSCGYQARAHESSGSSASSSGSGGSSARSSEGEGASSSGSGEGEGAGAGAGSASSAAGGARRRS